MSKTIWYVKESMYQKGVSLDKEVVVYENEKYYYCRIPSSYELRKREKESIERMENAFVFNSSKEVDKEMLLSLYRERAASFGRKKIEAEIECANRQLEFDIADAEFRNKQIAKYKSLLEAIKE